jgi:histidine triad (HIT) family protein
MKDSVFTKIIKGEIPSHKIYEDDKTFAFLDIHPTKPGHILVIPKKQIEFVWDLPPEDLHALWDTASKIAKHIQPIIGSKRIGAMVVGFGVPHAHVHLVPIDDVSELKEADDTIEPDHEALAKMAEKLRFE